MGTVRYVAIGDSFTEGVGDELPDGHVRGWADLVAQGWADASGQAIEYANLAIRGKLIWPIVEQQLEPALALKPTHLSFNGGGNDMLRPRASTAHIVAAWERVLQRCEEEGVTLIALSGANPSEHLPLSRVFQRRGDVLSAEVTARLDARPEVLRAFNWPDKELSTIGYWSDDRLHMNVRGHHRVAARVLNTLGHRAAVVLVVAARARRTGAHHHARVLPRACRSLGAAPAQGHLVGRRSRAQVRRVDAVRTGSALTRTGCRG